MEDIIFRKTKSEDWKKFREIRLQSLRTDPQAFKGDLNKELTKEENYWKTILNSPNKSFYIAEHEGVFIALVGSRKISNDKYMLISIYTSPDFRRMGISSRLITIVIDDIKKEGINQVCLIVNQTQTNAINMYKKLGLEVIRDEGEDKMGDGLKYNRVYMEIDF